LSIPKINKTGKQLQECKRGQIVKFPAGMSQDDVLDLAEEYGFSVWFYEPGDPEYKKHGRNVVRLIRRY